MIKRIIEKGYAGNQTEVIRQAILAYERMLEEGELVLVHRAVTVELNEIEAIKTPSCSFNEIKKHLKHYYFRIYGTSFFQILPKKIWLSRLE